MYALTDSRGWYLLSIECGHSKFTPDIGVVLRSGMAWLIFEVAQQKRKEFCRIRKIDLGIAWVDLVQGQSGWEPVLTQGVPP